MAAGGRLLETVFIRNLDKNILHAAREDIAQIVQRGGGDVAVLLQRIQGAAAERIVLDQGVGGNSLAPHGLPQRVVSNHILCLLVSGFFQYLPSIIFIQFPIEYSRYIGYNQNDGYCVKNAEYYKRRKEESV